MPVTITKQKNLWNKVLSNVEKNLSKDSKLKAMVEDITKNIRDR